MGAMITYGSYLSKKENIVNPYIDNYRSFELDYNRLDNNNIEKGECIIS